MCVINVFLPLVWIVFVAALNIYLIKIPQLKGREKCLLVLRTETNKHSGCCV